MFALPAAPAPYGPIRLVAFVLVTTGALALALTFGALFKRVPGSGGPYVYARDAFSDFAGFLNAWSSWITTWAGTPPSWSPRRRRSSPRRATPTPSSCTACRRCTTGARLGQRLYDRYGLDGAEVTNAVFESGQSVVFDQAENRLHTIKAVLVAALAP